ncbi:hypothetical protein CP533_4303 [Ophiocordyceps camponoti-saundersi (nom. inval.)]|nr:hypothetical protein CP533_4303 [Ophiocordyceps camponoti-saundersi (nom. inval.)]
MLIKPTLLSAVAALASLVSAENLIWVKNRCPFDIDVLSGGISIDTLKRARLETGFTFEQAIGQGRVEDWKHLKIMRAAEKPQKPHIQFSYYRDGRTNSTVYGLTTVFGGGWQGSRVAVESSACPAILWPEGLPSTTHANGNKRCFERDHIIILNMC